MNGSKPNTGTETVARSDPDWDVETLLERIWNHLGGTVSRSTIHQVLAEVLPNYESARVRSFIPLLVQKETVERLRAGLAEVPPHREAAVTPDKGLTKGEIELDNRQSEKLLGTGRKEAQENE